jgi:hypothetical protein
MILYRREAAVIPPGLSWQWFRGPHLHLRWRNWKGLLALVWYPSGPWYRRLGLWARVERLEAV